MIRRKLINFSESSCDFRVGPGALAEVGAFVSTIVGAPRRAVLVTSADLVEGPAVEVSRSLIDAGFLVGDLTLPAGEDVGTLAYAARLMESLAAEGLTADDVLVALGDAAVCSLVQHCARSWCGGTPMALVPATLDAMATVATGMRPLSCGGSAAMVWAPTRPALVVCDLDLVPGMPEEARLHGYLELLAAALMDCRRAWDRFGEQLEGLLAGEEVPLVDALCESQTARLAAVKSANPSARAAAEFGRTTARALRGLLGPDIPWYRLLAEGMRFEARLAVDAGRLAVEDVFELDDRIWALGIEELAFDVAPARFIEALRAERFRRTNRFLLPLPQMVGTIRYAVVEDEVLERHASAYLESRAELLAPED